MNLLETLTSSWRASAETLRAYGADGEAIAVMRCAEDLEEALRQQQDELLNLRQAADLTGFSRDHLGRQVRQGKIPNAGKAGAPKIRRSDLSPKSGGSLLPGANARHVEDATAIVQSVIDEGG